VVLMGFHLARARLLWALAFLSSKHERLRVLADFTKEHPRLASNPQSSIPQ